MTECLIFTLKVASIPDSVEFYERALGFKKEWEPRSSDYAIAGIKRGALSIYLCEIDERSRQAWLWIGGQDDSLFELLMASGAKIRQEPTNDSWAYELRIEDRDGQVLRLAAGPRSGLSFES